MKKIVLFIVIFILSLFFISCDNKEIDRNNDLNNLINEDTNSEESNNNDINVIKYAYLENIENEYLVGDEVDLIIKTYPSDIEINNIKYESSNEEILTIYNGHLKALKEGSSVIKVTVDDKKIERIVRVLDNEIYIECRPGHTEDDMEEWYRRREEKAKEKGFNSYAEYREYLKQQKELEYEKRLQEIEDKYQAALQEAESLGISFEDLYCLDNFNKTYEEMQENLSNYGYELTFNLSNNSKYGRVHGLREIDANKGFRHVLILWYLDYKLGYCYYIKNQDIRFLFGIKIVDGTLYYSYGAHYACLMLVNYYGKKIDDNVLKEIEDTLPGADKYLKMYDYLVDKVGGGKACEYIIQMRFFERVTNPENEWYVDMLTDEDIIKIEGYLEDYEE